MPWVWLKRLTPLRRPDPVPARSKPGEMLTQGERAHIEEALRDGKKACPDCRTGDFLQGPQGCGNVNVRCEYCGAEFNLFITSDIVIGERLRPRA